MSLLYAVAVLREYHDPRADPLLPLLAAKVLEDHVAELLELRVSQHDPGLLGVGGVAKLEKG